MKSHLVTAMVSAATTLGIIQLVPPHISQFDVDRLEVDQLVVRDELIVSDTGKPWEEGFSEQMVARGIYARGGGPGLSGLWVRGRLIQSEVDDPFDTRFQSVNRDGTLHRAPGHISWNCWIDGAWRQMAIIQGEGLEYSEVPAVDWSGGNHPGRLRFQSFRPQHPEPLTDAVIGQGMMSVGGGGYGGGGLPYPADVLQVWGGNVEPQPLAQPAAPRVVSQDGTGRRAYAIIALGPQGNHSLPSPTVTTDGHATLAWDSVPGADAYFVLRDDRIITPPLRIEGSVKQWVDADKPLAPQRQP